MAELRTKVAVEWPQFLVFIAFVILINAFSAAAQIYWHEKRPHQGGATQIDMDVAEDKLDKIKAHIALVDAELDQRATNRREWEAVVLQKLEIIERRVELLMRKVDAD
jgi:hypothetical protein